MKDKKEIITKNDVVVESGKTKLVLSESVCKKGYIEVEEARRLLHKMVRMEYELNG